MFLDGSINVGTKYDSSSNSQLCSVFSKEVDEDPGGSAPTWDRLVVMELKQPWKKNVTDTPHCPVSISESLERIKESRISTQFLCVLPDKEYSVEGYSRVMLFYKPETEFSKYEKDEFLVPIDKNTELVETLLEHQTEIEQFRHYRQNTQNIRDILVCTHGSRDTCCGSFGFPIYSSLKQMCTATPGDIRIWRVSHLGGHHFAPNLVDLPSGRYWCRLDTDELDTLISQSNSISTLKKSYRGWAGFQTTHEQIVEREILIHEGWDWGKRLISGKVLDNESDSKETLVLMEFTDSHLNETVSYKATVKCTGKVPKIDCMDNLASSEALQYSVSELQKVE